MLGELLFFTVIFSLRFNPSSGWQCYSCASPLLKSQWYVTGYPFHPAAPEFYFTEACDSPWQDGVIIPSKQCELPCVEMVLPLEGQFAVVRGCPSDFFGKYAALVGKPEIGCDYGPVNQRQESTQNRNSTGNVNFYYAGNRYCREDAILGQCCNGFLYNKQLLVSADVWNNIPDCSAQRAPPVTCPYCAEFNWRTGKCKTTLFNTCEAQWCTSVHGRSNGKGGKEVWISAGCAPINPLISEVCVKTTIESSFSVLGSAPIVKLYDVNQCFYKQPSSLKRQVQEQL
jgi:hypothetical protein